MVSSKVGAVYRTEPSAACADFQDVLRVLRVLACAPSMGELIADVES